MHVIQQLRLPKPVLRGADSNRHPFMNIGHYSTTKHCIYIKSRRGDPSRKIFRSINEQNLNTIKVLLQEEDWKRVYYSQTAEEAYNSLLHTITVAMDHACPRKETCTKKKARNMSFMDREASRFKTDCLKCLCKFQVTGNKVDKNETLKKK